jgi:hypothetical protein
MTASRNLPSALIDTFLAPGQAFAALRERPAWAWAALLVVGIASAASVYTLFGGMSPEWIVEQQLAAASQDIPADQLPVARANMLAVAPYTAHIGAVMGAIVLPLFALFFGFIYFVGERVLSRERNSFGRWFAAASFSMLPMLVSAIGLIVLVLVRGGGDLPLDLGNYASLNNLLLGFSAGESGYTLASSINVFSLWGLALVAVAARVWSGLGWGKAILLAALPSLLIYLPWLAIVLAQG